MEIETAVGLFAALAHPNRLSVFRKLVEAGKSGLPAGTLADELEVAPGTLSFHLKGLSQAGLITARAEHRFIYYSANFETMGALVDYLTEDCCRGRNCGVRPRMAAPKRTRSAA